METLRDTFKKAIENYEHNQQKQKQDSDNQQTIIIQNQTNKRFIFFYLLGSTLSYMLSYNRLHDVLYGAFHCLFSWFYVLYHCFYYSELLDKLK